MSVLRVGPLDVGNGLTAVQQLQDDDEASMKRVILCCSLFCLAPLFSGVLSAQVMQTTNYTTLLSHARALTAGATASDISHHLHYDVKYRDGQGHEVTATYDIYRDRLRYTRVDIAAPSYSYRHIKDLLNKREWKHSVGEMPLKVYDLRDVLIEPKPEIYVFTQFPLAASVHQQMIDGSPFSCADDNSGIRICFDPLIRSFAFAQVLNQTVTYDDWQRIGTHAVPGRIRLYDDKKLLVEATGKVEPVKQFPPLFFVPNNGVPGNGVPGNEPRDDDASRRLVHFKPLEKEMIYGNVQMQISVDDKGKVTRTKILDADNKTVKPIASKFAHSLRFDTKSANNRPASFTSVFYLHYFPEE
jgi:hypothetical protein